MQYALTVCCVRYVALIGSAVFLAALALTGCSGDQDSDESYVFRVDETPVADEGTITISDEVKDFKKSVNELPDDAKDLIKKTLVEYFGAKPSEARILVPEYQDDSEEPILVDRVDRERLQHGREVYSRYCASCHGNSGDGNGEAAKHLHPKPRDYRKGIFKFTSTSYASKPRRQDLIRTIRRGAKGTSMPSFRWMSHDDIEAVVDYVIMLAFRGQMEFEMLQSLSRLGVEEFQFEDGSFDPYLSLDAIDKVVGEWDAADQELILPVTVEPPYGEETIELGRAAFRDQACAQCHGADGQGQQGWLDPDFIVEQEALPPEERLKINHDAWGNIAPAADLTMGMLRGGRRPVDVYRRIYNGTYGTPMPGFKSNFSESPDTIWHLAHFIISISEGREFKLVEADPEDMSTSETSSGD
jgi:mono/diheme cytochrome c family protein